MEKGDAGGPRAVLLGVLAQERPRARSPRGHADIGAIWGARGKPVGQPTQGPPGWGGARTDRQTDGGSQTRRQREWSREGVSEPETSQPARGRGRARSRWAG